MARPKKNPRMTRAMQDAMLRRLQADDYDTVATIPVPVTGDEHAGLLLVCRRSGFRESDILRAGLAYMTSLYGLAVENPDDVVAAPDVMVYEPAVEALRKAPDFRYLAKAPTTSFIADALINTRYNIALRAHAAQHYSLTKGRGSNNSGGIKQLTDVALGLLFRFLDLPKPARQLDTRNQMRLLRMYTGHIMPASDMYRLALHLYMKHHDVFSDAAPDLSNLTK